VNGSDLALLERWKTARDAEAFRELVARHAVMVYATCKRILRNPADAEEVAQDCFARLAEAKKPPSRSLGGWLHATATHRSIDRLKADVRRAQRERAFSECMACAAEPTWHDLQELVDEAIAELPENSRVPIVAHFLEGETHAAIAATLGLQRTAVTKRIAKGIEHIRANLKRRGVAVGAGALATMLASQTAEAVPVSLLAALGRFGLAGAKGISSAAPTVVLAGASTAAKLAIGVVGAVALAIAGYQLLGRGPSPVPPTTTLQPVATQEESESGAEPQQRDFPARDISAGNVSEAKGEESPLSASAFTAHSSGAGPFGISPRGTASICGTVVDSRAEPVVGAQVRQKGAGVPEWPTTRADGEARFEATGLPAGTYELEVAPQQGGPWLETGISVSLENGEALEGLVLIMPDLAGRTVSGRIRDAQGRIIAGAQVAASQGNRMPFGFGSMDDAATLAAQSKDARKTGMYGGAPGILGMPGMPSRSYSVLSNEDGLYRVVGLNEEQWSVHVSHWKYCRENRDIEAGPADVTGLDFILRRLAAVEGRATHAETGEPVTQFEVREKVPDPNNPEGSSYVEQYREVHHPDGRFRIEHLDTPRAAIAIRANGFVDAERVFLVSPDTTTRDVVIALEPARALEGLVRDWAGQPVPDAEIRLGGPDGRQAGATKTRTDGSFRLENIPSSAEVVTASHPDYAPGWADLTPETRRVAITLYEGGLVEGVVRVDGYATVDKVGVIHLRSRSGGDLRSALPIPEELLLYWTTEQACAADGAFQIGRVTPGEAVLLADLNAAQAGLSDLHVLRLIEVSDRRTISVDLMLPPGDSSLECRVTHGGTPYSKVYCTAAVWTSTVDAIVASASSGRDGLIRIDGLPAGRCTIHLAPRGDEDAPVVVETFTHPGAATRQDVAF